MRPYPSFVCGRTRVVELSTERGGPMADTFDDFVEKAAEEIRARAMTVAPTADLIGVAGLDRMDAVRFCDLWPTIKSALRTMMEFLPLWAKWMARVLIKIGDRACRD